MWYSFQYRRKFCLAPFELNFLADACVTQSEDNTHNLALHLRQHSPPHSQDPVQSLDFITDTKDCEGDKEGPATMAENAPSANGVSSLGTEPQSIPPTATTHTTVAEQTIQSPSEIQAVKTTASATASTKKAAKQQKPQTKQNSTDQDAAEAGAGVKLTGAQLKAQKKAEKAARRAEQVALKGETAQAEQSNIGPHRPEAGQRRSSQGGSSGKKDAEQQSQHHKRKASIVPQEPGSGQTASTPSQTLAPQHRHQEKKVSLVSHLYPAARPASLTTAPREIHPSVLTLALHLRSLTLVGSTARTVSLLLTLKRVIHAYTTPPNTALSRHLTSHISHQISFLSAARPLGIAQGNAIRWLKKLISTLDPDLDENEAKKLLCSSIDSFIREKVTLAGELIASQACDRIEATGETILVYGKSSIVEKTLLRAAREEKKKFKVVIVDSRPLFEGRNLARALLRAGMCEGGELEECEVIYSLTSGLTDVLERYSVTKCFLGASGMLGNGSLYSRCGHAMVAMMAKQYKIPVLVLAETVKFTAKMAVDSLSLNEIGDADALVELNESQTLTNTGTSTTETPSKAEGSGKKGGGGGGGSGKKKPTTEDTDQNDADNGSSPSSLLASWRAQPNLYLLNPLYDVTPKEYIAMVICELGVLPPGAVPVVNGVHGGDE